VVELKSELGSVEATLRKHDEKVRLAPTVLRDRVGTAAGGVSRLLVLPDSRTARRQVERGGLVLERAYPVRGRAMSGWLRRPDGVVSGLLFEPVPGTARRRPAAVTPDTRVDGASHGRVRSRG
jgi:hypothetical protein